MANRLAQETSPYLRQARRQPGRLVPVGRGRLRRGPTPRRPHPAQRGLLVVPLVPRHGPRVVRGRRHRRAGEPPLREREGRPRGAARRRRHLHGRGAGHDRPRRVAHDGVPRPRRPPVLRRHLLPAPTPGRHALVHRAVPAHRRAVAHPPPGPARAGRRADRGHRAHRRAGPRRPRARRRGAGRRPRRPARLVRRHLGRLRRGPQVPLGHEPRRVRPAPRRHRLAPRPSRC